MAVNFYIADCKDDIMLATETVRYHEEIEGLFFDTKERILPTGKILLELDPYGERLLQRNEILNLIEACELVKNEYDDISVVDFADRLIDLCKLAIQRGKRIFAAGD